MRVPRLGVRTAQRGYWWVSYAATVLLVSALANAAWGIVELVYDVYSAAGAGSPAAYAWVWIGLAVVEAAVATALFAGSAFAVWAGIAVAVANGVVHAVGPYPLWGAIVIVLDASVCAPSSPTG